MKLELSDFRSYFSSSFEKLKESINNNLSDINTHLDQIGNTIKNLKQNYPLKCTKIMDTSK